MTGRYPSPTSVVGRVVGVLLRLEKLDAPTYPADTNNAMLGISHVAEVMSVEQTGLSEMCIDRQPGYDDITIRLAIEILKTRADLIRCCRRKRGTKDLLKDIDTFCSTIPSDLVPEQWSIENNPILTNILSDSRSPVPIEATEITAIPDPSDFQLEMSD
jgi:hypothetical protein